MKAKPFFLGLSCGIIGGVASVLFTTPQTGRQVRANIASLYASTKDVLSNLKEQTKDVQNSIISLKNEVQYNIPNIINDTKSSFNKFKQEIQPNVTQIKEEIEILQKSIDKIENNLTKLIKREK